MNKNDFTRAIAESVSLVGKGIRYLKTYGFVHTWEKIRTWKQNRTDAREIIRCPLFTREELAGQKQDCFPRDITFSILVPLYNTPVPFLREMIQSVQDQTYGKWELCLADGSDSLHPEVGEVCKQYAREDCRILYQKLEKNMGISGNTNACIEMSQGEYIALFDHDDVLHPAALHEVMQAICEQDADFIYTDETTFESPDITRVVSMHFKPDFAIDYLRANNYICHLTVFKRSILASAGMFRPAYDGSQDHDLVLRLTKHAEKIVHIPKVLYYWRSHPLSVAMDISSKEYAIQAGRNAVQASIRDYGCTASVDSSWFFPTIYRIQYEIQREEKVSILIPARNNPAGVQRCVNSVFSRSTYRNFEIIIAHAGSDDSALQRYCRNLPEKEAVTVLQADADTPLCGLYNIAAQKASGKYLLLLNENLEVITPGWIEQLLMFTQREDVAAAGSVSYAPNDTVLCAWNVLGMGEHGIAASPYRGLVKGNTGYMGRLGYAQDVSAVSASGMLIEKAAFRKAGGFDTALSAAYWDIDLCMRLRKAGFLIVWTPYAELTDYSPRVDSERNAREAVAQAVFLFKKRWGNELAAGDPYYNPNFRLDRDDFSLSPNAKLRYIRPV